MKYPLLIAAVLIAQPVYAVELDLSDFGVKAAAQLISASEVDVDLPNWIELGDTRVMVGQNPIDDLRDELGAAASAVDGSFCVEDKNVRLSVLPGEPIESIAPVGSIIMEPATSGSSGCHLVSDLRIASSLDVPSIGSKASQLSARFGGPAVQDGLWAYRNRIMLGDEGANWLLSTTLSYEVREGVVTAAAISQRTEASPTGLSRFKYWSPIFIAEQIDVTSFRNSIGPRREPELKTFSDYGFIESDLDGHTARLTDKERSWLFAVTVAEASDERLVLCILDQALDGGSYRTLSAIGFKDGTEGLLVATAEAQDDGNCKTTQ